MASILANRWSFDEDYFEQPSRSSAPTIASEPLGLAALAHLPTPRTSIVDSISRSRTSSVTRSISAVTGDSDAEADEGTTLTGGTNSSCPSPALEAEVEVETTSTREAETASFSWSAFVHFQLEEDFFKKDQCRCSSKRAHAGKVVLAEEEWMDRDDVVEHTGRTLPGGVRNYIEQSVQRVRLGHRLGREDFVEAGVCA